MQQPSNTTVDNDFVNRWYYVSMSKLIIANWKMNPPTLREASILFDAIKQTALKTRNVQTVIAPPLIFLQTLAANTKAKRVQFAAQNIHFEASGAQVGETSAGQAKDAGARYVLVGHSARRENGETDLETGKKVIAALGAKLTPVLFVGEGERDQDGLFLRTIRKQVIIALKDVPQSRIKDLVLCYEPVWAISTSGSDKQITVNEIHQMVLFVHKVLTDKFGERAARKVRILYGGSVSSDNADDIFAIPGVAGAAVGGASLDAKQFGEILQIANKT